MTGDHNDSDSLDEELENRLDELFGNDDAPTFESPRAKSTGGPLDELKSSVLSIDWEITDAGLQSFASKIDSARETFSEDKLVLMFLQILGALGAYIKTNRGNAHPRTFKILTSVFHGLEKVVTETGMSEADKKKTLQIELKRYNELRGLIQKNKVKTKQKAIAATDPEAEKEQSFPSQSDQDTESGSVAADQVLTLQALKAVIEDLKGFVHKEIEALRKDLVH